MKFEERTFSKRFPAVNCAVFVIYEPSTQGKPYEWNPKDDDMDVAIQRMHYRGTAAAVILPNGYFCVGVSLCSPDDAFVKVVGRTKAIGRAYAAMLEDKFHGSATIIEAVDGHPIEPRIGDVAGLTASLQAEIQSAKRRAMEGR